MARTIPLALLLAVGTHALAQELLEPEKASVFGAMSSQAVEIRYVIAHGYYLYREKFRSRRACERQRRRDAIAAGK